MSQIKQHGSGMQDLEQQIFTAGCQLRLVMEENQRFEEVMRDLPWGRGCGQVYCAIMEVGREEIGVDEEEGILLFTKADMQTRGMIKGFGIDIREQ